jgi:hypothetical protein
MVECTLQQKEMTMTDPTICDRCGRGMLTLEDEARGLVLENVRLTSSVEIEPADLTVAEQLAYRDIKPGESICELCFEKSVAEHQEGWPA